MATENRALRIAAETLYVLQGWTQKAIAEELDISEVTVSAWSQKYDWPDKRDAASNMGAISKMKVAQQIEALQDKIENEQNSIGTNDQVRNQEILMRTYHNMKLDLDVAAIVQVVSKIKTDTLPTLPTEHQQIVAEALRRFLRETTTALSK